MLEVVLASYNKHKAKEIQDVLKKNIKVLTLDEIGYKEKIEENGETLLENARIKAKKVREKVKDKIIIADDTGLEVDYLAKAPGVYSARFAGKNCSYSDNNKKLLKLLKGVKFSERKATFRTVIYIIFPDGKETYVEGRVSGFITKKEIGKNGFGYDPLFYYPPLKKTFAQLSLKEKNKISHRSKAIKKAQKVIKEYLK
jgi:XTP/dITP diphosphohydrolase